MNFNNDKYGWRNDFGYISLFYCSGLFHTQEYWKDYQCSESQKDNAPNVEQIKQMSFVKHDLEGKKKIWNLLIRHNLQLRSTKRMTKTKSDAILYNQSKEESIDKDQNTIITPSEKYLSYMVDNILSDVLLVNPGMVTNLHRYRRRGAISIKFTQ